MDFSAILEWKADLEKPEIWREYTMYHNLGEHRPVKLPGLAVGVLLMEATLCCGWIKRLFSPWVSVSLTSCLDTQLLVRAAIARCKGR